MLFAILGHYGVPQKIINAIASVYTTKGAVFVGGKLSKHFSISSGVLQGDVLAPYLFIMVIDYIMCGAAGVGGFIYKSGTARTRGQINDLDYAYDIAELEESVAKATEQLQRLADEAAKVGLEINTDKTEYMCYNIEHNDAKIMLNGKSINEVTNFKYLGSMMLSTKNDIAHRKVLAWVAYKKLTKIWTARHVSVKLKINILRASVISILLYGSEAWTLCNDSENCLNSFATRCYRQILGISYLDHISNEEIYRQVEQLPLIRTIQDKQLSWLGHTLRRNKDEPARIFALYEPTIGKAKRGRPTTSYLQYIKRILAARGVECQTVNEITGLAADRKRWTAIVKKSPCAQALE